MIQLNGDPDAYECAGRAVGSARCARSRGLRGAKRTMVHLRDEGVFASTGIIQYDLRGLRRQRSRLVKRTQISSRKEMKALREESW